MRIDHKPRGGRIIVAMALALALLSLSQRAEAKKNWIEHLSLELPVQLNLIGLSVGVQPELLFRPFHGVNYVRGIHLRAAFGIYAGPEMVHMAPLALGLRWVFFYGWRFQPLLGFGVVWQTFIPYGAEVLNRLDMAIELGFRVKLVKGWSLGALFAQEIGLAAITAEGFSKSFGLGMAVRITVTKALPW